MELFHRYKLSYNKMKDVYKEPIKNKHKRIAKE